MLQSSSQKLLIHLKNNYCENVKGVQVDWRLVENKLECFCLGSKSLFVLVIFTDTFLWVCTFIVLSMKRHFKMSNTSIFQALSSNYLRSKNKPFNLFSISTEIQKFARCLFKVIVMFFTFFKLYKWYQITQSVSCMNSREMNMTFLETTFTLQPWNNAIFY